jgi:amino acid adenylation domain-containing protein
MYTSGSTGTPKGVMIPHRGIVRLVRDTNYIQVRPDDVFAQWSNACFDAITFEVWGALLNGACVQVLPSSVLCSPAAFRQLVSDTSISVAFLTSAVFATLVAEVPSSLAKLRVLLTGGEIFPSRAIGQYLDAQGSGELWHVYGPTETTTFALAHRCTSPVPEDRLVPIGQPIANTTAHVFEGQLYLGGPGLALGYWNRPELTAEKFKGGLYATGDLVRYNQDGDLEFLGRADRQVKIRGFRIELDEVEIALRRLPRVRDAVALAVGSEAGTKYLAAFVTLTEPVADLSAQIKLSLPPHLVPQRLELIESFPLNANGKVDRQALIALLERRATGPAGNPVEAAWQAVLPGVAFGPDDNFFDVGGHSLLLPKMEALLSKSFGRPIDIMALFEHPTVRSLSAHLNLEPPARPSISRPKASDAGGIAIVGMAGRFPGARNPRELWHNLRNGIVSIRGFEVHELNIPDRELEAAKPNYVRARAVLAGIDRFDADFFSCYPQEAVLMDPQHRVFLEICWAAIEDAGYDPSAIGMTTGVWAGASPNSYFLRELCKDRRFIEDFTSAYQVGHYQTLLGTIGDTLATRVAYKLNLQGPAMTVLTACSTSLVAVCEAAKSLRAGECDAALAGGVSITLPQERGYLYQPGGMVSPDGQCRTFDQDANGTVFGSGAGVVLLKRVEDARRDRDHIYAVLKGWGLNNDGSVKAGFTAPSPSGQAAAIRSAYRMAGFAPRDVSYVEAHGTATPLGDPIEVGALKEVFAESTSDRGFCALGAAKPNVGHLDVAAGVTGLIKTALSFEHKEIPGLPHFTEPNPRLGLDDSPFFVPKATTPWQTPEGTPRRASVSAFGVGGTNAHVLLEEAPPLSPAPSTRPVQLFCVSGRSESACRQAAQDLAAHPIENLADAAFTLHLGRKHFSYRLSATTTQFPEAQLSRARENPPVYFLFPGQGAQYQGMGNALYESEPVYRAAVDRCVRILGYDPLAIADLTQTQFAQPALFIVSYALAQLFESWGIMPTGMLGHSVGEFVAATLAGVFTLEDALRVVAERGRFMQSLPGGSMLAVRLPEAELTPLLGAKLSLAAVNAPKLCVAAGPDAAIEELEKQLSARKISGRRLRTSHAFHSSMLDPIAGELQALFASIPLAAPKRPYLSSATGTWIEPAQATDPAYWARHCRDTVRFSPAVQTLRNIEGAVLLELGPGTVLQQLAAQHDGASQDLLSALPNPGEDRSAAESCLSALGKVWEAGVPVDWRAFYAHETRWRVSLPTYPFEGKRHWMNTPTPTVSAAHAQQVTGRILQILENLSGIPAANIDPRATFLDLGLDSLFLTQLTQEISSKFQVKIAFRQLMENLSSVEALSAHLAGLLSPAPAPPSAAETSHPPEVSAASAPGPASNSLESLFRQQMEAMNALFAQQLAAARGGAPAAPPPPAPPPEKSFTAFGPFKPIQAGNSSGITSQQRAALDDLIARYNAKTAKSKELTQRYRKVLADPRVAGGFRALWKEMVYPITTNRSIGSRLVDVDGNEYIDLLNGFGPIAFGHRPDFLTNAIKEQLDEGFEIGPQTPLAGEVAELICELTGNERVTFCNTGSEAVMAAMRVARTVTAKKKIVLFAGAYHGTFDEVLVKRAGTPEALRSGPIAPGIPAENLSNIIVLDYDDPAALDLIEKNAGEIAAVLVETVQSRHPGLQPREFLKRLRSLTEANDIALIFDEIVTGFRSHPGGVQALFGIRADLVTYGKVLGGGMPIGALAGKAKFMDALDGGSWQYGDDSIPEVGVTFFAGTFVRHPLALRAAKAVLEHIRAQGPGWQADLARKAERLCRKLNRLFERFAYSSQAETFGSVLYFPVPKEERFASLLFYYLRLHGIHIQEGFPCFLSAAHSEADLEAIEKAFSQSLAAMQAAGFLPSDSAPAEREVPLTESQIEVWLAASLGPEASCAFNEAFTLTLRGALDTGLLADCLERLVERHDALRYTFDEEGRFARVAPLSSFPLPIRDVASDAEVEAILDLDARTPFDLVNGPVCRAQLLRRNETEHVLLFTGHHIVLDGWSVNTLLAEAAELYSAAIEKRAAKLAPALPYSEFALQPRNTSSEAYWLAQYQTLPAPLELPVDRPRPAVKVYDGATLRRTLDPPLVDALRRVASRQGATLFSLLMGGLQILVSRLSGQRDISIGVPSAAQQLVPDRALVGHGVNFLPVRNPIAESATLPEFLRQTKTTMLDAYEHQQFTYGTLLRKLSLAKDPSRLPLIEVQFNLERVGDGLDFPGLEARFDSCPKAFVNFDLFLNAIDSQHGLLIDCDYNTALFDAETIARWLGHYETLLRAMAANPEAAVDDLPLLTAAERTDLLVTRNQTQAELPVGMTLDWFRAQVAAQAEAKAVTCGDRTLTYAQLDDASARLAEALRQHGAGPGEVVAVALDRDLDLPVTLLAIWRTGAAYVPLDPAYPKERTSFILQETRAKALVTAERFAVSLDAPHSHVICLDREWPLIRKLKPTAADAAVSAQDLAYIIYTSGSTGRPKGVAIEHGALANFLAAMRREPGLQSRDRLLAVTTISFDIAGLEIFLPLVTGAQVVIAESEAVGDGHRLATLIAGEGITALQATPSTWRLLLEAGWRAPAGFKMMCGGEALPQELAARLLEGEGELWNMYGPTETTIWSSVTRVRRGEAIRIGGPILNTTFYVLDGRDQPVPPGVVGELAIGGKGVARGYHLRPELSAQKFGPDPFRANGERMFRTGDLARLLPSGELELFGRSDNQVKIRGFRIELGEIESALEALPSIRECVVVAREENSVKRLVAYYAAGGEAAATTTLREALGAHLPAYMVPSQFVEVPALPRLPNGKIDRRSLPAPAADIAEREVKPLEGETQILLGSIVAEVLNRRSVGADDNFFELGADSIQIFQIVARARKAGLELSAQQVLRNPSVEKLAQVPASPSSRPDLRPIRPVSREKFRIQKP